MSYVVTFSPPPRRLRTPLTPSDSRAIPRRTRSGKSSPFGPYGHASIDQTLHYVGVDQEEMTEGFAVFDQHMQGGLESLTPPSQRQTVF